MQIVIKINEDDYKEVKEDTYSGTPFENRVFSAIANGTPLPKGHGRLIDVDRLELDYDWSEYETDTGQLIANGYQAYSSTQIESAFTIIEADTESEEV